jgi:hypothetical protein
MVLPPACMPASPGEEADTHPAGGSEGNLGLPFFVGGLTSHNTVPEGRVNYHHQRWWLVTTHLEGATLPVIDMSNRTTRLGSLPVVSLVSLARSHTCGSALHPSQPCSHNTRATTSGAPSSAAPTFHSGRTSGWLTCLSDSPSHSIPHTSAVSRLPRAHDPAGHSAPALPPPPSADTTGRSVAAYTPPPHRAVSGIDTWDRTPHDTCTRRLNALTF